MIKDAFTQSGQRHKGVTLIEILVVTAIIGIVIALTIAAVMAGRESSRRLTCLNNMHQIGLAMTGYVAQVGSFPPRTNGKRGYSAFAMILPQIEHADLYNTINFSSRGRGSDNLTASSISNVLFLCPSDNASSNSGRTNYACNGGYDYQAYKSNGIFVGNNEGAVGLASVIDGTSNTAMMSEWLTGRGDPKLENKLSGIFRTSRKLIQPGEFEQFVTECSSLDITNSVPMTRMKGKTWLLGDYGNTAYNHDIILNNTSCLNLTRVLEGAWTASSNHQSGVNVLFADGHAQFVRQSIEIHLWRAISTRSGGEVVSGNDL